MATADKPWCEEHQIHYVAKCPICASKEDFPYEVGEDQSNDIGRSPDNGID